MSQQFVECDGKVAGKVSRKTGGKFRIQSLVLFTGGESWPHVKALFRKEGE
jgi:predicted flavoprotein YhiN